MDDKTWKRTKEGRLFRVVKNLNGELLVEWADREGHFIPLSEQTYKQLLQQLEQPQSSGANPRAVHASRTPSTVATGAPLFPRVQAPQVRAPVVSGVQSARTLQSGTVQGPPAAKPQESGHAGQTDNRPTLMVYSQFPKKTNAETRSQPRKVPKSNQDPPYRTRESAFYQTGRVFEVHWPQPHASNRRRSKLTTGAFSYMDYVNKEAGTSAYAKFRRMIVVQTRHNFSVCVPIYTYGGQGCSKKGVAAAAHAIVIRAGENACATQDEISAGLNQSWILQVRPPEHTNPDFSLAARVNLSKCHTIEHDVPVRDIGALTERSAQSLYSWWYGLIDPPEPRAQPVPYRGTNAYLPQATRRTTVIPEADREEDEEEEEEEDEEEEEEEEGEEEEEDESDAGSTSG